MNAALDPGHILTKDGLAFKGEAKIVRINCDYSLMDVRPLTWQCNRLIRRDFYLVCYKMFFVLRHPKGKGVIRQLLHDVREEAEALEAITRRHEIPDIAKFSELHLRLVNEEARILLESMVTADKALAKMQQGPMHELADDNFSPFSGKFHRLKEFAIRFNNRAAVSATASSILSNHRPEVLADSGQSTSSMSKLKNGP